MAYSQGFMLKERNAVNKLSVELARLFWIVSGKEPDLELIKEEAEGIVAQYGDVTEIRDMSSSSSSLLKAAMLMSMVSPSFSI